MEIIVVAETPELAARALLIRGYRLLRLDTEPALESVNDTMRSFLAEVESPQ